jgi:hypothetical protein
MTMTFDLKANLNLALPSEALVAAFPCGSGSTLPATRAIQDTMAAVALKEADLDELVGSILGTNSQLSDISRAG